MKKNLMIFTMLLLSVLMVSVVSAGITGYALSLREGRTALAGDLKVSNVQVKGGVGSVDIEGVQVSGREGETVTTSEGASVIFQRVKSGGLFSKPKIEVVVTPKVAGSGFKLLGGNTSCIVCTEKYKVLEGEVQVVQGNDISIDYIDADSTALSVNGAITSDLNEGQTFQLDYGEIVIINDVYGIPQGIGKVELCLSGCYKVLEGEVQVVQGNDISIDYIDADSTALSVNGAITSDLNEGQTFQLSNGQIVTIDDVYHPGIGGQIGEVEFCLSSSY